MAVYGEGGFGERDLEAVREVVAFLDPDSVELSAAASIRIIFRRRPGAPGRLDPLVRRLEALLIPGSGRLEAWGVEQTILPGGVAWQIIQTTSGV